MESIIQLRQMMAEQKFFEAQQFIEVQLTLKNESHHELLLIYYECLKAQQKKLSSEIILELAEHESANKNHQLVMNLLNDMPIEANKKYYMRILKLKAQAANDQGQIKDLHSLLSDFLIGRYEKQNPSVPGWVTSIIDKYFMYDFNLKLKELALSLSLNDLKHSEKLTVDLIISCVEKSSPKGISNKLLSIGEVLRVAPLKAQLEIYQNFCFISANGIKDKTDYKRIVEMVIFYDQFNFQVLILNLLYQMKLSELLSEYAETIRSNADYNFVYLDKFFPHLKSFFVQPVEKKNHSPETVPTPDLKLTTEFIYEIMSSVMDVEDYEDEQKYLHLLKHQIYQTNDLCDLAVSFLQSEMPRVALKASELAIEQSKDDKEFLKSIYLKLTCLLQLKEYRSAMDVCFQALDRAHSKDDILSFLYAQAEIYIRLNEVKKARNILSKVLSIDSQYRMAKERLDKLNEI